MLNTIIYIVTNLHFNAMDAHLLVCTFWKKEGISVYVCVCLCFLLFLLSFNVTSYCLFILFLFRAFNITYYCFFSYLPLFFTFLLLCFPKLSNKCVCVCVFVSRAPSFLYVSFPFLLVHNSQGWIVTHEGAHVPNMSVFMYGYGFVFVFFSLFLCSSTPFFIIQFRGKPTTGY